MTPFSKILDSSKNKTRVLLYNSGKSISNFVLEILCFHHKDFNYFFEDKEHQDTENDFVIFETSNVEKAAQFQPNIVMISEENNFETIQPILKNIVSGGILIYPQKFEPEFGENIFYFRKLSFSSLSFQKTNDKITLNTEIGAIPLHSSDENIINNLEGIKLLSQQFGIMEEEFYEAVMSFE